jgi:hypothetical protein
MTTRWNPAEDGITHLNVYSRAKTDEGKWASNFQYAPFIHPMLGRFHSIEGLWYWLSVSPDNPKRDQLMYVHGAEAKKLGRELRGQDWVYSPAFEKLICQGIRAKYATYPEKLEAFRKTTLPLAHYYVMMGKPKYVTDGEWILQELDAIRRGS